MKEPDAQEAAVTVDYVAAAGPLLAQPVLRCVDTLDKAAVQFLLAQSLLERQKEEEKEKEKAAMKEAKKAKEMAKVEEQRRRHDR